MKGIEKDIEKRVYDKKTLTEQQRDAYLKFLDWLSIDDNKEDFVLSGYSGSGKSYTTGFFINAVNEHDDKEAIAIGFTAKSVSVLANKHKVECPTSTIHGLIYRPKSNLRGIVTHWELSTEGICDNQVIFIDEYSFLDDKIIGDINKIKEMNSSVKVCYIGDPFQLQAISKNTIKISDKTTVFLTDIVRQAKGNPVIEASLKIREGKLPRSPFRAEGENGDFISGIRNGDPRIEKHIDKFGCVLVGTNRMKSYFDRMIREKRGLDPKFPQVGDTLMAIKNHKGHNLLNGLEYKVVKIAENEYELDNQRVRDMTFEEVGTIPVSMEKFYDYKFNVGSRVEGANIYDREKQKEYKEITFFTFNHSITVHKSQGSTMNKVLVHTPSMKWMSDYPNALYTAITRTEDSAVIIL